MFHARTVSPVVVLLLGLALAGAGGVASSAYAQTTDEEGLQDLLEDVGQEYAESYLAPLVQSFGVNQNSGLYTTAAIPGSRLTFSIGVKAMAARLAEADSAFRRVLDVTLDETFGVLPGTPGYGEQGTVEMSGPTVFGSEDRAGTIRAYYEGVLVAEEQGIEGVWESRTIPLAMPEASLGGVAGFKATVRWLPEIDAGDAGKIKLWGYGLQYSVNRFFPLLPADVMIGFFRQSLDIGDVLSTDATSWFLAGSKSFSLLTLYGGVAKESADFDVDYTWKRSDGEDIPVSFSVEGKQSSRVTLGAALNLGVKLNADVNVGSEMTSFSAGLMFGL